ncbi:MAG: hypothetical protein HRF40_01135 [Nitrososphaera sp.]
MDNGILELSLKLHDPSGQLLVEIERNEWKSGDPFPWDIESSYQWLTIHHKKRAIALDIDARTFPPKLRADLWYNKQHFRLDTRQIRFDGVVQDVQFRELCLVGMRFVVNSNIKQLMLQPDPRFGQGMLISEPDITKRIHKGIDAWKKLEQKTTT